MIVAVVVTNDIIIDAILSHINDASIISCMYVCKAWLPFAYRYWKKMYYHDASHHKSIDIYSSVINHVNLVIWLLEKKFTPTEPDIEAVLITYPEDQVITLVQQITPILPDTSISISRRCPVETLQLLRQHGLIYLGDADKLFYNVLIRADKDIIRWLFIDNIDLIAGVRVYDYVSNDTIHAMISLVSIYMSIMYIQDLYFMDKLFITAKKRLSGLTGNIMSKKITYKKYEEEKHSIGGTAFTMCSIFDFLSCVKYRSIRLISRNMILINDEKVQRVIHECNLDLKYKGRLFRS